VEDRRWKIKAILSCLNCPEKEKSLDTIQLRSDLIGGEFIEGELWDK